MADEAWAPVPGETPQAFTAFCAYRDQVRGGRSIDRAFREQDPSKTRSKPPKNGRAPGQWFDWSARFKWVERAAAWDAEQDRIKRQALRDEIERTARRHIQVAGTFERLVVQRLQKFNERDIAGLTAAELIRWFEAAVKIQRQALGLQDEQKINMTVVFKRAQELAEQYGVTVEEIMAEADTLDTSHALQ